MIRFAIDGPEDGPGYVLIACVDVGDKTPALLSGVLKDERAIAGQARELADAAAALLEQLPAHAEAFEKLHDVIDALPMVPA